MPPQQPSPTDPARQTADPAHQAKEPAPLASIGAGNMGGAIILGSIDARAFAPSQWAVADTATERREDLQKRGINAVSAITDLAQHAAHDALILLAVKPQHLPLIAKDLRTLLQNSARSILSILAGTTTDGIRATLARPDCWAGTVIRAMPNTPASIGRGSTALALPDDCPPHHAETARRLLASVGRVHELPEPMIDPFTAIAGSGPAYLFAFAEALSAAAESLGFDHRTAATIAADTVTGAAELLHQQTAQRPDFTPDPATLRVAVTSKGGTTAAALASLAASDLDAIIAAAAAAARDRAVELARETTKT
mgnify:CR=1 FL=1